MAPPLPPGSFFSIRAYTANMRSVDFDKCWPFEGDGGGSGAGRSLPPMSVKRFSWWADELGAPSAVDDEGEGKAKALARGRPRAPKKRSIADLFAAAAPVANAAGGEEEDGGAELEREKKRNGKVKVSEENTGRKRKWVKKKKKKKDEKNKITVEICATKQGKLHKPKMPFSVDISQLFQSSMHTKRLMMTLTHPVDRKKESVAKKFQKKHTCDQTSKLLSRKQKNVSKVFPIHSILKNGARGSSMKKRSISDVTKPLSASTKRVSFSCEDDILGHKEKLSSIEPKIFSNVLASSSITNDPCEGDELPLAMERAQFVNHETDISTSAVEKIVETSLEMQESKDPLVLQGGRSLCGNSIDTEQRSLVESMDLNNAQQSNSDLSQVDTDTSNLSPNCSCTDSRVNIITHEEDLQSKPAIDAEENCLKIANGSLPSIRTHLAWSDALTSLTTTTNSSRQPASYLVMHTEDNEKPFLQQVSCSSLKDSVGSTSSSAGSKRLGHLRISPYSVSIYKDECIGEDYVGLPLNSQGEFIKNQNSKFGFCKPLKRHHNTLLGSDYCFPASNSSERRSSMDHAKMFTYEPGCIELQGYGRMRSHNHELIKEKDFILQSDQEMMRALSNGRTRSHNHELVKEKDFILQSDEEMMRALNNGCRDHSHMHRCINATRTQSQAGNLEYGFQPDLPPTMRLMGKHVIVGSKHYQGSYDGKMCTDKQIVTEEQPTVRKRQYAEEWINPAYGTPKGNFQQPLEALSSIFHVPVGSKHYQGFYDGKMCTDKPMVTEEQPTVRKPQYAEEWINPAYGTPKGNFQQPLEASSSIFHVPVVTNGTDIMHFDSQGQYISRDGLHLPFRNYSSPADSFSHPIPPITLPSKASNPSINPNWVPEGSDCQNVRQRMLLDYSHSQHSQSVAYSKLSTSQPSFLNQSYTDFSQPFLAHSSSNLPQWLLEAAQRKNQNSSNQPYPNPIAVHKPCNISGTNFFSQSSPHPTSVISFPVYRTNTTQAYVPSVPDYVVQTSVKPHFIMNNSSSAVQADYHDKLNNRDGTSTRFAYFVVSDLANRSRKRIADNIDRFIKPAKKPNSKILDNSNAVIGQGEREQVHGSVQLKTGTIDFLASENKIRDMRHPVVNTEKDEHKTAATSSSYKPDRKPRSGPFKLSAGIKHILEPIQPTGHGNSRSIHSTVPFTDGNNTGSASVSHKKAAKIYMF